MSRPITFLVALLYASALGIATLSAAEVPTSTEVAQNFWNAFLNADTNEMRKYYAAKVTLKAGSELLKTEYGLNDTGDRGKDLTVDSKAIIRGYEAMFERVGKQKWMESGQKLRKVQMSFISVADSNRYFALFQATPGDLLIQIHTEPEPLFFLLRQNPKQQWRVAAEAFD